MSATIFSITWIFPGLSSGDSNQDIDEPESLWYYQHDPDVKLNQTVTTRDLISWSFQVARGMDYLASKKVKNKLLYFLYTVSLSLLMFL